MSNAAIGEEIIGGGQSSSSLMGDGRSLELDFYFG